MRCLVVGCGFVGEVVCRLLHDRGFDVTGVVRSGESAHDLAGRSGFSVEAADVSDELSVRGLAERAGPAEVVVHCASSGRGGAREAKYRAVYLDGCRHLLAACPEARPIFVSSSSVYGQKDGIEVTEESATEPDTATSRILREAEELALAEGGIVVRLAGIYGPGRSFLLKRFLEGKASIDGEGPGAEGRWVNQVHREDAGSAVAHLAGLEGARGIYNACDDTPLRQRALYEEFSRRLERPVPPVRSPDLDRPRGWSDKRVSNAKLRATGWQPRYPSYFDALQEDAELLPSILESLNP